MLSKSSEKKLQRKQKRVQQMMSTLENPIEFSDIPTKTILVCNAGLSNGLQQEVLLEEVVKHGTAKRILMEPGKTYCWVVCESIEIATHIFNGVHGLAALGQNETPLILSYSITEPPQKLMDPFENDRPTGLQIVDEFITEEEELEFLKLIDWSQEVNNSLKNRLVKHFGYEFLYGINTVNPEAPLDEKIPTKCSALWPRLHTKCPSLSYWIPEQMTANHYEPGHGIPPHVDTHSPFQEPICSLSLGSDVTMEFRHSSGKQVNVRLKRRSLLVMTGECRFDWTHGIAPRTMDVVSLQGGDLTISKRQTRVSFTFRKLRSGPCECNYPQHCDTERDRPAIDPQQLELENVHKVYDQIADHFSETRHKPWPQVMDFINSLPENAILLDIGCGNGKYLQPSDGTFKIGCDRSEGLLNVCRERSFNSFRCDCLYVPIRSTSIDACISIAVLHHLASKERRLQAIQEMCRVLVPGGQGLIYVWAKNQSNNDKDSNYLKETKQMQQIEDAMKDCVLPIHTNRTKFKHQDLLVPWKLKPSEERQDNEDTKIFLRYYHVFEEFELDKLIEEVPSLRITKRYYDQGNWCVVFRKM